MRRKYIRDLNDIPIGNIKSHFLDSGSFSLKTKAILYQKEHGGEVLDFYNTDEFWKYMDAYATFIRRYAVGIDYYANVDVIPNPELSWRNLRYLEKKHGLSPIPVIHFGTHMRWIKRHIQKYPFIALGGLVGNTKGTTAEEWLNNCFNIICDTPDRTPCVRVHGFGVTKHRLLFKYPWYSVDSTSWTKLGAYGGILIPKKRNGEFLIKERPFLIKFSHESGTIKEKGRHYLTLTDLERLVVKSWLDKIGVAIGTKPEGEIEGEDGVISNHNLRRQANLLYYEILRKAIPKYPWPFEVARKKGFL